MKSEWNIRDNYYCFSRRKTPHRNLLLKKSSLFLRYFSQQEALLYYRLYYLLLSKLLATSGILTAISYRTCNLWVFPLEIVYTYIRLKFKYMLTMWKTKRNRNVLGTERCTYKHSHSLKLVRIIGDMSP